MRLEERALVGLSTLLAYSGMAPFSLALALVAALLFLEILAALLGGSVLGIGDADAPMDIDASLEIDGAIDSPPNLDFGAHADADLGQPSASGLLSWLGVGQVPFMIWLAGLLTCFGVTGYAMQLACGAIFGTLMPAVLAVALAILPAIAMGARFARLIGRLVPATETSAVSRKRFGGLAGVLAQGVARRGHPAQARIQDHHGNIHYVHVEPWADGDEIRVGENVLVLRTEDGYRAMRLSKTPSHGEVHGKG